MNRSGQGLVRRPRLQGLLAALLMTAVCSATGWAASPQVVTLANGLTVVLKEEHKAPVVSFQVWYKVGSRNEINGKTGLSHLLEHMMFKGAAKYGKGEYSRLVAKYGGNENAFTSRDYTAYYMNWAPQHLPLSVALETDRMTGLLLDEGEYLTERKVVQEERRMRIDDNPVYATVEQVYATAYLAHPYRQPVIGWMGDLEGLSRDDAADHYRRYYHPNNATVVVVGDFDQATLLQQIKDEMGALPAGPVPPPVVNAEPEQIGERRVILRREAQLPFLLMAYPAPNWSSPDAYALAVLANILFEGKTSRMYQRLVYEDQMALDEGGDYDALSIDNGVFYLHATAAVGHQVGEVEAAIREEVAKMQQSPPTKRELARARNQVEAGFLLAQDSVFYQAMRMGEAVTVGAGIDYLADYPAQIRKVTAADVQRVANTYLVPDHLTVGTMLPLKPPAITRADDTQEPSS